jgi:autoinducer 2-degrading protein
MYCLYVTFHVQPGHVEEFSKAAIEDASDSLLKEQGCFAFNVMKDAEKSNTFYLFEAYRDKDAFEQHVKTPHFSKFWNSVKDIVDKNIERKFSVSLFPEESRWHKP